MSFKGRKNSLDVKTEMEVFKSTISELTSKTKWVYTLGQSRNCSFGIDSSNQTMFLGFENGQVRIGYKQGCFYKCN